MLFEILQSADGYFYIMRLDEEVHSLVTTARLQDGETFTFRYKEKNYLVVRNTYVVVCELIPVSEFVLPL